jgi:hypothetical protein
MNEHCEECERNARECQYNDFSMMDFCGWLDNAPTVDAVPVVHGYWEEPQREGVMSWDKRSYAQCSVCKKKSYLGWKDNWCRYCGAKMDLEEQDAKKET